MDEQHVQSAAKDDSADVTIGERKMDDNQSVMTINSEQLMAGASTPKVWYDDVLRGYTASTPGTPATFDSYGESSDVLSTTDFVSSTTRISKIAPKLIQHNPIL